MDILTDLFREAGLRRRLLDLHHLPADRALHFACGRSVGFHVVVRGTVHLHAAGEAAPIVLGPGDITVIARGTDHLLTVGARLRDLPVDEVGFATAWAPDGMGESAVVSGAYQLWNTPVHPFFAELPPVFVLRAARTAQMGPVALTVAMLAEEAQTAALGRETVLHGLLDVLFTQLLREIVAQRGEQGACWSHAVREPRIGQAVTLLHEEFARDWSVESLAQAVGMSRSALAARFRESMGDTPLSYLRTVRLQRAMRLLSDSSMTLEQVAAAVGYNDAFSFSKAFKKAVGESPGEFRRRDASERNTPWRLPAADAVGAR